MSRPLATAWAQWSVSAIPSGAPLQQRASMKTAFMCGASVAIRLLLEATDETRQQLVEECGSEIAELLSVIGPRSGERTN